MSAGNDKKPRITPSVAKLKRLIGTSPAPRMLTPYEIELLRKAAKEVAEVTQEVLAMRDNSKGIEC